MSKTRYIYGRHPVLQQLAADPDAVLELMVSDAIHKAGLDELKVMADKSGVAFRRVSKRDLSRMLGRVVHQGIAARLRAFSYADLEDLLPQRETSGLVVILDQIQDPHNFGSVVRSALALGAQGVVIAKDRACEVTPAVVKSSAGAVAHLPIVQVSNIARAIEQLKTKEFWVVGTVADGGQSIGELDLKGSIALVIGAEGAGLRQKVAEHCDFLATIPMVAAAGSFNASVATAICLYEATRQRSS